MNTKLHFVGFDALKKSVSMVQLLDHYGLTDRLHRSGDSLSGPCPIHTGHNTTQFRVSISKNCWICFGDCHIGGSIIDFVARKERIGIREAALLIQDWFGIQPGTNGRAPSNGSQNAVRPVPRERFESHGNPPLRFALSALDASHPYLVARGLSADTIATFGVGYCTVGSLAGRIAVPIHDAFGRLLAYAGRTPGPPSHGEPKYRLPRGFRKSLELFNLHRISPPTADSPLIVVEGFFGCMNLWQCGYRSVVAVMGSMMSGAQAALIAGAAGHAGRVLILFDEDEAGRKGRQEATERLGNMVRTQVVRFEVEGTQPDDLTERDLHRLLGPPANVSLERK